MKQALHLSWRKVIELFLHYFNWYFFCAKTMPVCEISTYKLQKCQDTSPVHFPATPTLQSWGPVTISSPLQVHSSLEPDCLGLLLSVSALLPALLLFALSSANTCLTLACFICFYCQVSCELTLCLSRPRLLPDRSTSVSSPSPISPLCPCTAALSAMGGSRGWPGPP